MEPKDKLDSGIIKSSLLSPFCFLLLLASHSYCDAKDWKVTPSFTLSESYSDNINLATAGNVKGAFVTEISPGISIRKNTARNSLNLDYRMQNLYNAGASEEFDIFHQLQFNSNSEIIRNALFVDLRGSISQQNSTNSSTANDNLSGSRNRSEVITYGISPYWTPHVKGYLDGEVRFNYEHVSIDNSLASNTDNFDYLVRLNSGRRFSRVTWFIDHATRDQRRTNDDDVKFQESLVEIRGSYNRHFNVFSRFGYSDNSFQATTNNSKNGFFYSFGGQWKPTDHYSLEAAWGNNSFVTLDITPIRHLHLMATYRDKKIGTNTGSTWEASIDYRTKRSIWAASYIEDTTTTQTALSELQGFTLLDDFGNPIINPISQQPAQSDLSLPTLVNEVFIRKRAEITFGYRTGRSQINTRLFNEKRIFQVTQNTDDVVGVSGTLDWRFIRRTSFFISPSWLHTKRLNSQDNRFDIALGFTRRIPLTIWKKGGMNARIEYRHVNQTSDIIINEYVENRISAFLQITL